jgi:hypothetical protein
MMEASRWSLFDTPVPEFFASVVFDRQVENSSKARTVVSVDEDTKLCFYTGILRAVDHSLPLERDNFAFLHSKELAHRASSKYTLLDVATVDFCKQGIAVFMNQGFFVCSLVLCFLAKRKKAGILVERSSRALPWLPRSTKDIGDT